MTVHSTIFKAMAGLIFRRATKLGFGLVCLVGGVFSTYAQNQEDQATSFVGLRELKVESQDTRYQNTAVALFYPTSTPGRSIDMGPFRVQVAIAAPAKEQVKGLIMLSHGTGGSELGHSSLAQALASRGYLVAALRHPGDHWQDTSLIKTRPADYFYERPAQVSRVITAILSDPLWKDRIGSDAKGPKIGVLGHSAGGYTVLALVGAEPNLNQLVEHCVQNRNRDPVFCSTGSSDSSRPSGASNSAQSASPSIENASILADPRVRAAVALAPVGALLTGASLAKIKVPTMVYEAALDRWLVPEFHSQWIRRHAPQFGSRSVPNAWHFAFLDTPSMSIPSPDGDLAANPPGFERQTFLRQLGVELVAFFDQAMK